MSQVSRDLTTLALTRLKQAGELNVRQHDLLRRALATAGEALGWAATSGDPISKATKDVTKMVRSGSRSMKREIAATLVSKETEISALEEVAASARELGDAEDLPAPAEITYSHTALDASVGLITKTETLTVTDTKEAQDVAATIAKSLPKWDKLRKQMLIELEEKQRLLGLVTRDLSTFVGSLPGLLREVIATLT